jgi:lipopolysaccharide export system protein LptA
MGVSFHSRWATLLALVTAVSPAAWGILPDSREPISLDADSSEYDREAGSLKFSNVRIVQGSLSIVADLATADDLDFADSSWQFTGNVVVKGLSSRIDADSATLTFSDHRLVQAMARGAPATFERQATEDTRALNGHAGTIDYDLAAQTLTLSGEARLVDGQNEINGETLLYRLGEERLVATSDDTGDQRVRITVTPQTIRDALEEEGREDEDSPPATEQDGGQ